VNFFDESEKVTENNLSNKYPLPKKLPAFPLVHPNSNFYHTYALELRDKNDSELWENIKQGKVKFRLQITYKSLGREYLIIQTENISRLPWEDGLTPRPTLPQKWK